VRRTAAVDAWRTVTSAALGILAAREIESSGLEPHCAKVVVRPWFRSPPL